MKPPIVFSSSWNCFYFLMVSAIFSGMPVFRWHQNYCHYTFVLLFFICKVGAATQAVGLVAGLSFLYKCMQGGSGGKMCAGPIPSNETVPTDKKRNERLQNIESSLENNPNNSVDEVCCLSPKFKIHTCTCISIDRPHSELLTAMCFCCDP